MGAEDRSLSQHLTTAETEPSVASVTVDKFDSVRVGNEKYGRIQAT